jgi:serine/threonine-protein kinase
LIGTLGAYVLGRLAAHSLLFPTRLARADVEHAPDLVGRELEEARAKAQSAAGGLDVLGLAYSAEVDSDAVLFQYPAAGMPVEPGKPIEVVVSAGAGSRRMPDVTGLPDSTALAVLRSAGAGGARVRSVAEPGTEKGTVVFTEPAAGAPLAGQDPVVVGVSRGGDIIEVPNLAGKTADEATRILEGAQLRVGRTELTGSGEGPGELVVVGQDPPAGGLAASGSAVDLRLGRAPASPGER